jgi:hypothetical protein
MGKHGRCRPRIAGVVEMLIRKIEYEESNHAGGGGSSHGSPSSGGLAFAIRTGRGRLKQKDLRLKGVRKQAIPKLKTGHCRFFKTEFNGDRRIANPHQNRADMRHFSPCRLRPQLAFPPKLGPHLLDVALPLVARNTAWRPRYFPATGGRMRPLANAN